MSDILGWLAIALLLAAILPAVFNKMAWVWALLLAGDVAMVASSTLNSSWGWTVWSAGTSIWCVFELVRTLRTPAKSPC